MKKRILFLCLICALALTLLVACGEKGAGAQGLEYTLKADGTYAVTGVKSKDVENVIIPDTVQKCAVTEISASAFADCEALRQVTIPDSVTYVGENAFSGCTALETVSGGAGITSIGNAAFSGCTSLKNIVLAEGLTTLRQRTFEGCTSLKSIALGNHITSIGRRAFSGCTSLIRIDIGSGVRTIAHSAFLDCDALSHVEIADLAGWCEISFADVDSNPLAYAGGFYHRNALVEYLVLPSKVTEISANAFYGCDALVNVKFPETLTAIGEQAFYGCGGLVSITLGDSLASVGENAFAACGALNEVHISDLLSWCAVSFPAANANPLFFAGNLYLDDVLLSELSIPEGTTHINDFAFAGFESLRRVKLPASLRSIGDRVFMACEGITHLELPFVGGSLTENTFIGYLFGAKSYSSNSTIVPKSLEEVTVYHTETVPECAFYGCYYLDTIRIGDGVKTIGANAFNYCTSLRRVYFGLDLERIENAAFLNCQALWGVDILDLSDWYKIEFVSYSSNPLYYATRLSCNDLSVTSLEVPEGVEHIGAYAFYNGVQLLSVKLPESLKSIGAFAFYNCEMLDAITIPGRVETVGESAFANCIRAKTITLGSGVKTIEKAAFSSCKAAQTLSLGASVEFIGNHAFLDCKNLQGDIFLPLNLKNIDEAAFENCSAIVGFHLPAGLKSIGKNAFRGCQNYSIFIEDLVSWCGVTLENATASPFLSATHLYINGIETTALQIPAEVKRVRSYVFAYARMLQSVVFAEGIEAIELETFMSCTMLSSITLPDSLQTIGNNAFTKCNLRWLALTFGTKLTAIGDNAFAGTLIMALEIPDNVTMVGTGAFENCQYLRTVTIGKGVKTTGKYMFSNCQRLTSVTLSDQLEAIDNTSFQKCASLSRVVIPKSVKKIGYQAFAECTRLSYVYYEGTAADFAAMEIDRASNPDFNVKDEENFCVYFYSELAPEEEGRFWHYDENGAPVIWKAQS